jgi:hypothetical protein
MVVCLIGIVMVILSIYGMSRIASVKGNVSTAEGFVPQSRYKSAGSKELAKQTGQYDTEVTVLLIAGILIAVGGCCVAIIGRKGKRKGK